MLFCRFQQFFVALPAVHLTAVLLPMPCFRHIGRVKVYEHIRIAGSPHEFNCRPAFYLHAPETLCRLHDPSRQAAPVTGGICPLTALHIILPADFLPIGTESMAHVQAYAEIYRFPQTVLRYRCKGLLIYLPCIGCVINLTGKLLRVLLYPAEQVHHVPVQVIYCLNV